MTNAVDHALVRGTDRLAATAWPLRLLVMGALGAVMALGQMPFALPAGDARGPGRGAPADGSGPWRILDGLGIWRGLLRLDPALDRRALPDTARGPWLAGPLCPALLGRGLGALLGRGLLGHATAETGRPGARGALDGRRGAPVVPLHGISLGADRPCLDWDAPGPGRRRDRAVRADAPDPRPRGLDRGGRAAAAPPAAHRRAGRGLVRSRPRPGAAARRGRPPPARRPAQHPPSRRSGDPARQPEHLERLLRLSAGEGPAPTSSSGPRQCCPTSSRTWTLSSPRPPT
jgi:hypothetical protein